MELTRRGFLQSTGGLAAGMMLSHSKNAFADTSNSDRVVRMGIVGTGGRGHSLLGPLLQLDNVEVKALCDINKKKCAERFITCNQCWPEKAGRIFRRRVFLQETYESRGSRRGHHCNALAMAYSDGGILYEHRQVCWCGSSRGTKY